DEEAASAFTEALQRDLPVTALTNLASHLNPLIKSAAVRAAVGTLSEPAQEVAQGVTGRQVLKERFDPSLDLMEGADVEALGGIIGGAFGGALAHGEAEGGVDQAETPAQAADEFA